MKIRSLVALCALVVAVALSGCSSASGVMSQASTLGSIAGTNPNLSTFMGLAQSAGLEKMLTGKSPLTLLAPSNDAFKALSPEMLANLAKPENKDQLTGILKNHMISGGSSLDQLAAMTGTLAPKSLTGSTLNVEQAKDGSLVVGGARITETVKTGNGYVHMVDRVILPQ
jgi:uncharacterized surface protein with fasciclin (FAS1) repeats